MAYIEDQSVSRGIKRVMERENQLNWAEARAGVSADFGKDFDHVLANLVRERLELCRRKLPEVGRVVDL